MKRLATVLVTSAAFTLLGGPAFAAPAQHDYFDAAFDGTQAMSADENPCGPYAAVVREVRSGGYKLVAPSGGQQPGELHINGSINGHLEIVPTDPSRPTYSGSYREKVTGVFIGTDGDNEDVMRVGMFRLRVPLAGSDGSRLVLTLAGKETLKPSGAVVVERFALSCS